ncbi:hypothetical protein UFOVP779_46 [uncultured Caudovirales phage]|uniref:Uncharacterized protein n=1 Tax=uncultured Caudovirales phage TaxID=2100421 RepID=A0A6J5NSX4_9CAUD|nr:hypothetical protein UFOVP779_46 [uncultured Caudovirales phage]
MSWLAGLPDPYATQTQAKSQASPKEASEAKPEAKEGASCGQSWVEGGQAGQAEAETEGQAGLADQQVERVSLK